METHNLETDLCNSIIYLETRDTAPHIIYSLSKGRDTDQCFATRAHKRKQRLVNLTIHG